FLCPPKAEVVSRISPGAPVNQYLRGGLGLLSGTQLPHSYQAFRSITSSSTEENFGFWIDEATKVITLADGKRLNVGRLDDRWISAVSGDVSYELDRQNSNLTYAGSTMKDGIATTIIGAGRCRVAAAQAG